MRVCGWWWWWWWVWWWVVRTWMVMTLWLGWKVGSVSSPTPLSSSSAPPDVRTNIVAEVPGLDVGPLVSVNVALGDTARLPCRHPKPKDDTVSLVLWYRNHTSRPFLSFDARADMDIGNSLSSFGPGNSLRGFGNSRSSYSGKNSHRMWLEDAGTSLVVQDVRLEDRAEYRCRVHFRLSPTWTQRLLLAVSGSVSSLVVVDGSGVPLEGGRVGPFSESSTLNLQCKANHGSATVESLVWLLDGMEVDSTWEEASNGIAFNKFEMEGLQHRHHRNHLTCRLTTTDPDHVHFAANITDVTTVITMFRVPEVKLRVEEASVEDPEGSAGGGWEVSEGSSVTLVCSVSADPPAYNITWLHKGRVVGVGGRRWRRDNSTLVITPVTRSDGGLYTCLASNKEGDGHSNAVRLRIAHAPQCKDPTEKHLVVATKSSVNITCEVEALPENVTFTWTMVDAAPEKGQEEGVTDVRGGIITGDGPPPHHPGLIDLTPGQSSDAGPWLTPSPGFIPGGPPREITEGSFDGSVLHHRVDVNNPTRSVLTLAPTAPVQLFCYARNKLGRTRIPCTYILAIVEPPEPLRACNITAVDVTRIEVRCDDPAPAKDTTDSNVVPQINYSPGLSFVRSSEVRTTANMQVWSGGTMVANVSADRPEFTVSGLPPASSLKLVLFAVSPHARSQPVYMYANTLPRVSVHLTEPSAIVPDADDFHDNGSFWNDMDGTMGGVVGGVIGGACVIILALAGVFVVIWCRQRRREELAGENAAFPSSMASPASGSLSHVDSPSQMDIRPSVYCVSKGSEGHETPWLETSITPLVAPATPITPTQPRVETLILEDSTSSDVK